MIFLFTVFDDQSFQKGDEGVHDRGENAQDKHGAHDEIELKHLPAVDDQIADARFGYDIFAHNRSDPRHADVDFQHGNEIRKGGGDNELGENLQLRRAHRAEEQQFIGIGSHKAAEHI